MEFFAEGKEKAGDTISLTFGDAGENHVGMELLGEKVEVGNGFSVEELEEIRDRLVLEEFNVEFYLLNHLLKEVERRLSKEQVF